MKTFFEEFPSSLNSSPIGRLYLVIQFQTSILIRSLQTGDLSLKVRKLQTRIILQVQDMDIHSLYGRTMFGSLLWMAIQMEKILNNIWRMHIRMKVGEMLSFSCQQMRDLSMLSVLNPLKSIGLSCPCRLYSGLYSNNS